MALSGTMRAKLAEIQLRNLKGKKLIDALDELNNVNGLKPIKRKKRK